ncbi:hypothetical protein PPROV_000511500 [Pycnococcus provasolii]|uniref:N-acetyltransferase domain-containing protein n=1 Tax=Pycnococcus provasolii TaxID=41880 RepID=A0A830HKM5_9CHLO|nr:hypothetical protein PPROV_000511500 [Pycnococcus provasolii]
MSTTGHSVHARVFVARAPCTLSLSMSTTGHSVHARVFVARAPRRCLALQNRTRTCASSSSFDVRGYRARPAGEDDAGKIASMVLREAMNPLGLKTDRFLVVEDDENSGEIAAFGQLKPWPCLYRQQNAVGAVIRALDLKPDWSGELYEMASIVVAKKHRGKGVGSELVRQLITRQHDIENDNLVLLTLAGTSEFYRQAVSPLGLTFERLEEEDVPRPIKPELFWGKKLARAVANDDLVVLKLGKDKG